MLPKTIATVCLTLCAVSASAATIPVLTFEGSQDGALIQDFYNGGTDSYGNRGGDYGVTFSGGIVRVVNGLTFLTDVTSIRVARSNYEFVSFNYSTRQVPYRNGLTPSYAPDVDDFRVSPLSTSGTWMNDSIYLGNTTTGFCQEFTGQFCLFSGAVVGTPNPGVPIGGFTFANWAALDTIAFGSSVRPPNERAVPEPATIGMLSLGMVLIASNRKRRLRS